MEKVLGCGLVMTDFAKMEEKAQGQLFCDFDELQKDNTEAKKEEIKERDGVSDYHAFMKKCHKLQRKYFPSIFSIIKINERKINFQQEQAGFLDSSYPLLGLNNSDLVSLSCKLILRETNKNFYAENDLLRLVTCISNGYNITAYHSFTHGVSLMHLLQDCLEKDAGLKDIFTMEERNFCYIAALAHDINHPGSNNAFENKMNTQWSKMADKESTLQKMHIRYLFELMRTDKNLNLEHHCENPLLIKELITRTILSTDICKHFSNLQKMKQMQESKKFDKNDYDHRYFIMENLFHACDIGNPCLPFNEYMNWAALVVYEFNNQSEQQLQNNLQVSEYLQYKGKRNFYEGQLNFINVFIYPLWKQLTNSWPGLQQFVQNIEKNSNSLKLAISQQSEDQAQLFIQMI